MKTMLRHVVLPATAPLAVIGLYFTPVLLFGCVNRGLMAVAVVLISAAAAFATIAMGFRARAEGRPSGWWLVSALILTLPLVLILGPLG
jgi:hypothetical protein